MVGSDKIAPIHAACSVGNESVLNYLLFKKFVDPNVRAQTNEWVPLELACWHGHPRVVNILLKDKRTNLNYSHPQRGSCLHLASKGQHFQIVQMLLMHNIDFTIKTQEGKLAKEVTNSKQILNIIAWYEKNQNNKVEDKNAVANIINEINEEENEDEEASSFTPSPNLENNLVKQAAKRAAQEGSEEEEDKSRSPPNQKAPFSVLAAANERSSLITPKMGNQKKPQSKIQMRLRAISGDNHEESTISSKGVQEKTAEQKKSSFVLVANPSMSKSIEFNDNSEKRHTIMQHELPSLAQGQPETERQASDSAVPREEPLLSKDFDVKEMMKVDLGDETSLGYVIKELKSKRKQKRPYAPFFPIKRLKGTVKKVHRTGLQTYSRFLYVNPIEGVLISYQNQSKFPHSPSYIIKLGEIKECGVLFNEKQSKWFFKRNQYYFIVRSDNKTSYFFCDNLDLVQYWQQEIHQAKEFNEWYRKLTNVRYDLEVSQNKVLTEMYDFIIDTIISVNIPECDLDQYSPKLNIDVATYANNLAKSFQKNQQQVMGANDDEGDGSSKTEQTPASTSDGFNQSGQNLTPPENRGLEMAANALQINDNEAQAEPAPQTQAAKPEASPANFKKDLERMKEMQGRVELPPDEIEKMKKDEPVLLDDGIIKGIGYKSFEILDLLGHGAFGKVFKCKLRGQETEFAMKVLKKAFLYKNKHLKYAITECNILKQANHPYVIKMHYSFQTPENLYMILDYCNGCDLAYHLSKKQIFEEEEARFFIAEIILAIEYIHSLDVIYRDLKPENILIDSDGHCRLADFGLAKENIGEKDFAKSFCGSPAYLPPEMLYSKGVSKAADIYQIGAVLYEFLVGFPPYYTENIKELYNSIRSARLQVPKYISKEAKDVLNQLLNKKPDKRITIEKVKQHEFFKDIDWEKLKNKEIDPPVILRNENSREGSDEENEEYQFLKQQEKKFFDRDYTHENKLQNRLKQFTFIKGQRPLEEPQPPLP